MSQKSRSFSRLRSRERKVECFNREKFYRIPIFPEISFSLSLSLISNLEHIHMYRRTEPRRQFASLLTDNSSDKNHRVESRINDKYSVHIERNNKKDRKRTIREPEGDGKEERVRTKFNLPVKEKLKRPSAYRKVAARAMLLRNGFRSPDIFNSPPRRRAPVNYQG